MALMEYRLKRPDWERHADRIADWEANKQNVPDHYIQLAHGLVINADTEFDEFRWFLKENVDSPADVVLRPERTLIAGEGARREVVYLRHELIYSYGTACEPVAEVMVPWCCLEQPRSALEDLDGFVSAANFNARGVDYNKWLADVTAMAARHKADPRDGARLWLAHGQRWRTGYRTHASKVWTE